MSGSEAEDQEVPVGADEAKDEVTIAQVSMVAIGGIKGFWIPTEQKVDGHVFVLVSKWDTGLAKLVLGKGLARHKSANREQRTINVQWFDEMRLRRHLAVHFQYICHCIFWFCQDRHACFLVIVDFMIFTFCRCVDIEGKEACNMLVRQIQNESRRAEGLGDPEKPRVAKDDDQWLVGQRWVTVDLPSVEDPADPPNNLACKVVWGVGKGDVWVERRADILKMVILGIRCSPPVVKVPKPKAVSPKRKRKLRKRPSNPGRFSFD